jgi:hypothetical protein
VGKPIINLSSVATVGLDLAKHVVKRLTKLPPDWRSWRISINAVLNLSGLPSP